MDSCDSIPATKASPAPVASTASTFKPCTLPLKSWKNYRIAIFRLLIIIKIRYFMPVLQHWTKRSNSYKCSDHHIKRLSISILWYSLWDIIIKTFDQSVSSLDLLYKKSSSVALSNKFKAERTPYKLIGEVLFFQLSLIFN